MSDYKIVDAEKLDADLSSVADAIRTKGGTSESLTFPQGFVDGIGAIESGGTEELENLIDQSGVLDSTEGTATEKVEQLIDKAETENIWYEQSANWTDQFWGMFKNAKSNGKFPRLKFDKATTIRDLLRSSMFQEIDYYISGPNLKTVTSCFAETPNLKHIVGIDISKATNGDGFFANSAIEEIDEPLNPVSMPSYAAMITFNGCNNLRKISFVAESIKWSMKFTSAVLTAESIQSIIDGLATVTTAQTLMLNKNNVLTDEQKATISNKGWTLTLN